MTWHRLRLVVASAVRQSGSVNRAQEAPRVVFGADEAAVLWARALALAGAWLFFFLDQDPRQRQLCAAHTTTQARRAAHCDSTQLNASKKSDCCVCCKNDQVPQTSGCLGHQIHTHIRPLEVI